MTICADERGIGDGSYRIAWSDVAAVGIRTTAGGPYLEDLFGQILHRGGLAEIPGGAVGPEVVEALGLALPGLDFGKLLAAAASTENRTFALWHTEAAAWRWDDASFGARFAALVARLGGNPEAARAPFQRLRASWGSAQRRYHDLEHLADCLREVERVGAPAQVVDVASLALWYHDAVHEPGAGDAEARSADWLRRDAAELELSREAVEGAARCILATAHLSAAAPPDPAAVLAVDADLAILGRDPLRFLDFEYSVAEEYGGASTRFLLGRGRFLAGLLARPAIFHTPALRLRYEEPARANLSGLLRSPRYRVHRWFGPATSALSIFRRQRS